MTPLPTPQSAPTRSSRRRGGSRILAAVLGMTVLAGCASEVSGVAAGASAGRGVGIGPATAESGPQSRARSTTKAAATGVETSGPAADATTDATEDPVDPTTDETTEDAGTPAPPPSESVAAPSVAQVQANLTWLKPGARASYYVGVVSSAADRYSWTENPAGDYTDPKTGKKYSSDRGLGPASQAAEGVMQFDVLAVGNDGVAFGRTSATFDRTKNVFTPIPNAEAAMAAGQMGQVWIAPETLTAKLGTGNDQDQVLVGPVPFEGKQVQAVVFVNNSPSNYYFHAYDQATGLLLQADTSVAYTETADGTSPPSTNTRTHLELKSVRQRTTPGFGTALPEWIGQGQGLTYGVKYALMDTNTGQPMSTPPVEYTEQIQFKLGGAQWANYSLTRTMNGQVENATGYVTGAGPYLMDPTSLASMKAGAELDTDPLTGEKVAVQQVDAQRVIISVTSNGNEWLGAYDKQSGALVQSESKTPLSFVQTQLQQS